jgi:hypothetical protein
VWIEGQLMPRVHLSIDGRGVAEVGGQLSGNSLVPDTIRAGEVELAAGTHRLALSRGAATLEPGDGGSAVVDSIFLTPASHAAAAPLDTVPLARWHDLCRHTHSWAELLRG